jgi:DNA polymerase I-like protein with 3'-5' exonuclease and polymerase domains
MNIITTKEQLDEFVSAYMGTSAFAFDVETIGEHRVNTIINDVCWISFSTKDINGNLRIDVIPMGHPNGEFETWEKPLLLPGQRRLSEGKTVTDAHYSKDQRKWKAKWGEAPAQLTPRQVFDAIEPLMFSDKLKIGHNIKFDLKSVAKYYRKRVPTAPYFDTMMAAFITDNRIGRQVSMKDCVEREFRIKMEKDVGKDISVHSFSDVAKYSGLDADYTWRLYETYAPRIVGNLQRVWKLEMDVMIALCDMELAGATIDTMQLDVIAEQIERDKIAAEARVYRIAGKAFPINSVKEKQLLLFSPLNNAQPRLKPNKKYPNVFTTGGLQKYRSGQPADHTFFSCSADALEYYRGTDELVDALLSYQDLNKLMTTYVTPYKGGEVKRVTNGKEKIVDRESLLINGKVHTNFKSHGAETGRFSSSEPNLQNIPSSGEYGKLIRNLFVAPPGYKLVVADYSQIEPRVIAALSNDPVMVDNYTAGGDIYTTIGNTMGVDRKAGKVLVLAISYGVGPDKIAASIGCSVQEAKDLLTNFEKRFSSISKYKAKVIRQARSLNPVPYVETLMGRRRYIPDLKLTFRKNQDGTSNMGLIARAERQAFNTMIQGSAADIMKLAIIRAHSCFTDEPEINVLLTVHDELVTVCPEDRAEEVANAIRVSMEGIRLKEIKIPLLAEVNIVDKWGEAK